jgi:hypothetical protein
MNNPDYISESLILKFFDEAPDPRWKKLGASLGSGMEKFGSGINIPEKFGSEINIPDPQH